MNPPRKILAIKLRSLGDTVLMSAPIAELRRVYPFAEIHVLILTQWREILEHHPAIHKIICYDKPQNKAARAKALARLAIQLRREKFDTVVNFHASPSSSALALATGAHVRSIHFHGHKDRNRYSTVEIEGKGVVKPIIERDMDAVRALGIQVPAGRLPHLELLDSEKQWAHDRIQALGLTGPVLGLGLGASRPSKSWPLERYVDLALQWIKHTGGSVIAVAAQSEMELQNRFLKSLDDWLSVTQTDATHRADIRKKIIFEVGLPLRQLMSVIGQCAVFAGNDSGPRHLAVGLERPTVTVFGPEDPFEWHPYPAEKHPHFFVKGLPCRRDADPGMPPWCGISVCVQEQHRCMTMIGVHEVLGACLKVAKSQ